MTFVIINARTGKKVVGGRKNVKKNISTGRFKCFYEIYPYMIMMSNMKN